MEPPATEGAVYELTVRGALGPMLRSALPPHARCTTEAMTIMRTGPRATHDLVELVRVLDAFGLRVEEVTRRTAPPDPDSRR